MGVANQAAALLWSGAWDDADAVLAAAEEDLGSGAREVLQLGPISPDCGATARPCAARSERTSL